VGNVLFEPILQCVSSYTATHIMFIKTIVHYVDIWKFDIYEYSLMINLL